MCQLREPGYRADGSRHRVRCGGDLRCVDHLAHGGAFCPGRRRRRDSVSRLSVRGPAPTLPFWQAWFASTIPFAAVHLFLFLTMPWPVAMASVLLAATTSIPLSHLYELGGRTIWAPALLHFTIQSVPKIFVPGDSARLTFPLTWITVCGTFLFLVLLIRVRPTEGGIPVLHRTRPPSESSARSG